MRRALLSFSALLALALLAPAVAPAETIPVDLTLGYRWLDLTGNEEMYRTQINERSGFLVRDLSVSGGDFGGSINFIDHFRLDAADVGAGPAGLVRLEVGRTGYYNLRASYRRVEHFSLLPAFANPLLEQGETASQHTAERVRTILDTELEILPGRVITPIVGYTFNSYSGPGTTTYRLGENEFLLNQDLDQDDQEFRVGASFAAGAFSGSFVQGWRKFEGTETASLVPGKGDGNFEGTILELNDPADAITRTSVTEVETPVTNAFVAGSFGPVKISGGYVRTSGESETTGSESSTGFFASYEIARFFKSLNGTVASAADATYSRGNARLDWNVLSGVDFTVGYRRQKRELEGTALLNDLYLQTINYHGLDPKDVKVVLQTASFMSRTEDTADVGLHVSELGPFSLRVGYFGIQQDITVTQAVGEIVIPGGQGGTFERNIDRFEGALRLHVGPVDLTGELRSEKANDAILRTDFLDRTTLRGRASLTPADWFRISGQVEQTDYSNDEAGVGLDGSSASYGVDAEVAIGTVVRLRAGGAQYKADSTVPIRRPVDFATETSVYSENGSSLQGGLSLTFPGFAVEGAFTHFSNSGSWPLSIDRVRVRAELDLLPPVSLVGEFDHDAYREKDRSWGTLANYNANRIGLYVRFKQ